MRSAAAGAVIVCAGVLATAGCQSTQDKARELAARQPQTITQEQVAEVTRGTIVKVRSADVLSNADTTVVAVKVTNTSGSRRVKVPVAIDVKDAKGASVFQNNTAGIGDALKEIAVLRPKETMTWVNDQVTPTAKPASVTAVAGDGQKSSGPAPRVTLQQIEEGKDADAATVSGYVKNKSDVTQTDLPIHAVYERGGKIVAAGRAVVPVVEPGGRERFDIYLVGDPTGARMDLAVPPTTLR